MAFVSGSAAIVFLLGRILVGGVLAFMGLNHFLNGDQMVPYAEAKGVPAASIMIPFTGGMLLFGGLAVVLGVYPMLGAGALAVFLLVATPMMHDFWAVPEDDQQNEMTQFLKNAGLLGATLGLVAVSALEWPYAVGLSLV